MHTIRGRFTHVPKSKNYGAADHALFGGNARGHAGRGERNARNGAGGGRGRGKGGKDHGFKSRKADDSASASGEENSKSADCAQLNYGKIWNRRSGESTMT